MKVCYYPAAEAIFFDSISEAPDALKAFFDRLERHFRVRSDTSVAYTFSNDSRGDMRIWAFWKNAKDVNRDLVTATLHWQPRKKTIKVRCYLTPPELGELGFDKGKTPKAPTESLNSEIFFHEDDWARHPSDIIAAMDAAANKAILLGRRQEHDSQC